MTEITKTYVAEKGDFDKSLRLTFKRRMVVIEYNFENTSLEKQRHNCSCFFEENLIHASMTATANRMVSDILLLYRANNCVILSSPSRLYHLKVFNVHTSGIRFIRIYNKYFNTGKKYYSYIVFWITKIWLGVLFCLSWFKNYVSIIHSSLTL